MTDRVNAIYVALERDVSAADVQQLIDAIRQFRNVLDVCEHVADVDTWVAQQRARHEIIAKLLEVPLVLTGESD